MSAEEQRLKEAAEREADWKRWGPYLSERQWGTVREDYSATGEVWNYFPHDHARSRAYRWGEDGLLGITDRQNRLCFAPALWNGKDPYLKERLFGLTGPQGNHGEDVKENYYYLDSTPTHSYMKALYKYPQRAFPYGELIEENGKRGINQLEYELADTGAFDEGRYFDIYVEYAKAGPDDILIRITAANRGPEAALLHLLPTLWFRNTWSWGCRHEGCTLKPRIERVTDSSLLTRHETLPDYRFEFESFNPSNSSKEPTILFTDNETNSELLFDSPNGNTYVKDAFHRYLINNDRKAVNPRDYGTKAAPRYHFEIPPGEEVTVRLRLYPADAKPDSVFGSEFERIFENRLKEANEYHKKIIPAGLDPDKLNIMRQAYAGLLWSKQFYHYIIEDWLEGDPNGPEPPEIRKSGRNSDWKHIYNRDIISMPDKWEYPWYAAWDLAFHMIPFAVLDPEFSRDQLMLFLREWYMHPNGQIPAYEFAFSDVNPPVHAWSAWRVYKITGPRGERDRLFLERVFMKLLLNFTWWVNRKDVDDKHIFAGGFLGMDNVGVFDRSQDLPTGGHLEQADGTAWMAFYCTTMLAMALELAVENPAYEDIASKLFEHFVAITDAINTLGGSGLWDEEDGFYYDKLSINGEKITLKVRSMVGLVPLFAVEVLEDERIAKLPGFKKRLDWFLKYRSDLARHISYMEHDCPDGRGKLSRGLLAVPSRDKLERVLRYMLDEEEFLSPYGLRSLSKYHQTHPYVFEADGREYKVEYVPGESNTLLFGGNSNWRGPVWFPMNYLVIEALQRYHYYYGDEFKVECPTGSGNMMNLNEVAREISSRLIRMFTRDSDGRRPVNGDDARYADDPHWKDLVLFHEYFHGETGHGLGASHQTGWTALIAKLLRDSVEKKDVKRS